MHLRTAWLHCSYSQEAGASFLLLMMQAHLSPRRRLFVLPSQLPYVRLHLFTLLTNEASLSLMHHSSFRIFLPHTHHFVPRDRRVGRPSRWRFSSMIPSLSTQLQVPADRSKINNSASRRINLSADMSAIILDFLPSSCPCVQKPAAERAPADSRRASSTLHDPSSDPYPVDRMSIGGLIPLLTWPFQLLDASSRT